MKKDFEQECQEMVDNIAKELLDIYNGEVESDDPEEYGEKKTLREYFDDCLDVNYLVSRDKEYKSAIVCITWGGPNIYVDTEDSYVKLYWGCTQAKAPLSYQVRDEIDSIFEEWYCCC